MAAYQNQHLSMETNGVMSRLSVTVDNVFRNFGNSPDGDIFAYVFFH